MGEIHNRDDVTCKAVRYLVWQATNSLDLTLNVGTTRQLTSNRVRNIARMIAKRIPAYAIEGVHTGRNGVVYDIADDAQDDYKLAWHVKGCLQVIADEIDMDTCDMARDILLVRDFELATR